MLKMGMGGIVKKKILETTELQVRELHPREQILTPTTFI
jgi:hypothetical protein